MNKLRKCKQCGETHELSDLYFRSYYGGRKGFYRQCRLCEKVNTRYKYLTAKPTLTDPEREELEKIDRLFQLQLDAGLQPPGRHVAVVSSHVHNLLAKLEQTTAERDAALQEASETLSVDHEDLMAAPPELLNWLSVDLTTFTVEYLQDKIADELMRKYRPQTGIDENYKPIYDDTHRDLVNAILKRFDDYEEEVNG